jgi:hypothetical protein
MFETLRFATTWQFCSSDGRSSAQSQEYLVAKDGRFRLLRKWRREGTPSPDAIELEEEAFDGHTFWRYQRSASGSHATIGGQSSAPNPIGVPTYFMPHLVGDWLRVMLADPNRTSWSDLADGSWATEWQHSPSGEPMTVVFDPDQGFVVTRANTWSQAREVTAWVQIEYCRTGGGFWYPIKGEYRFQAGNTAKMLTTDFRLNERDPKFQIDIPTGTLVADYRTDPRFPETYYQGLPRTYGGPLGKTYEDTLKMGGRLIAGVCTNADAGPVFGALVRVYGEKVIEDGGWVFRVGCDDPACATTDAAGRFAMPVPVDGKYTLVLDAKGCAPAVAYDVPQDTKDLKVTFVEGGTVSGRVVRADGDVKSAVAQVKVAIKNLERGELEDDYDQETVTDQDGRFTFKHLSTHMRSSKDDFAEHWTPVPRPWTVSVGKTSVSVVFDKAESVADLERVVEPDPNQTSSPKAAGDRHEP